MSETDYSLPLLETEPTEASEWESVTSDDAPWGYKADGTPRKKPGRKSGTGSGSTSSTSSSSSRSVSKRTPGDSAFRRTVEQEIIEVFVPMSLASPLAYAHVCNRAEKTSFALVKLAEKHPGVKAALESYFASVAYKDIALFIAGIPIGFMIDMGMMQKDAMVGRIFGMEDMYDELYVDEGGTEYVPQEVVPSRGLQG